MTVSACITSVSGPVLLSEERAFLRSAQPWGVILMGRSCQTRDQVRALVDAIQAALGREALIFIDQEGGRVARLRPPEWPRFPPAALYGELYELDPDRGLEACFLGYKLLGGELARLGIRANCAPVADLRQATTHDAIGDRAFGYRVQAVAELAEAALDGMLASGVVGCLKHMPGQGRASVDSHHDLPRVSESADRLELDFSVFSALSGKALMGMTGHVSYDVLVPGEAATVSERIIHEVIRGRIGFDGLLMSDDLGMNALGGDLGDRGRRAIAAGCDLLLHCSGFLKDAGDILREMDEIAEAAGALNGAAERRTQAVMAAAMPGGESGSEAEWARYLDLMAGFGSGPGS